jgi:hypothetical protein
MIKLYHNLTPYTLVSNPGSIIGRGRINLVLIGFISPFCYGLIKSREEVEDDGTQEE